MRPVTRHSPRTWVAIAVVSFGSSALGSLGCAAAPSTEGELVGELVAGSATPDGAGFVAVDDGTDVELVPGSQGGFHVWLGLRVRGVAGLVTVERRARRAADDALIYRGQPQSMHIPDDAMDDWWDDPYVAPAFMCPSPIGIQVFDEDLVFEIRIFDDADEILAEDRLVLTPRCPEGDHAAFCVQICSG